jgi:hypothetical protein
MQFSPRSEALLRLLHECGQVATMQQLTYNDYDNGRYCTQLTVCLKKLVKSGYISVSKLPRDWEIKTTTARYLYTLLKPGTERLGVPSYELNPSLSKSHLMLSEVVRQFNEAGYSLEGGFFREGIFGFKLKAKELSVFVSWDGDYCKDNLKYFLKRRLDPETSLLVFFHRDKQSYLDWKLYSQSTEFYKICSLETYVYMPQLPLSLPKSGESEPFTGWNTASRIEV